jgi:hypothetical protein
MPLLEGVDLARRPLTGYPHVDQKLVDIRNLLWISVSMVQKELTAALALAIPLANLAGQAVSDNMFDATISEGEFQKRVRSFLRSHPNIGSALEEHARAAGGITDLSFDGIRLELKSEGKGTWLSQIVSNSLNRRRATPSAAGKNLRFFACWIVRRRQRRRFRSRMASASSYIEGPKPQSIF